MIKIDSQADTRTARNITFCYSCGMEFKNNDIVDYDHIPSKKIFHGTDRDFPLKLPIHKSKCHSSMNLDDEVLSQLFSLIHGKYPSKRNDKLNIEISQNIKTRELTGSTFINDIEFLLRRWIKGFHAALYNQFLGENTRYGIQSPLPSFKLENGLYKENPLKEQHFEFVKCIKRNRLTNNLDTIKVYNNKLIYECVWDQLSNKNWICVFAINLYEWKNLGDIKSYTPRGCAGFYEMSNNRVPINAALSTCLDFPFSNIDIADPFSK